MKKTVILFALFVLCACGSGTTVELKKDLQIEYGSELKVENLTDQKGITLKETKDFDPKKLGEQKISVIFLDSDGKEINQEITLEVKDTKGPEIILVKDKVEITAGDDYDAKTNIKSVKDPVDGDIKYNDAKDLSKDGYQVTGELKKDTAGEYKQKVTAFDKNGNKTEKVFTVHVKEKEKEEPTNNEGRSSQPSSNSYGNKQFQSGNTPTGNAGSGITNNGNNGGGQTNTSGNGGGSSQPTKPTNPVLCPGGEYPEKPCDACVGLSCGVGNSGMWFNTREEADAWAESQVSERGNPWRGYGWMPMDVDYNDGTVKWTVQFY